ncbi:MAG TPA: PEGA domain-containing protein [Vicinamibacterales bacterium]|nr:PEGA domain-containing protein [Vicinamibacterales bacterium]
MESVAAATLSPVVFSDGLGQRRHILAAREQRFSVLFLDPALTRSPAFEDALKARIARLAPFQHAAFARVRGIVPIATAPARLAIASEAVPGPRLSDLLAIAEQRLIPLEINAALAVVRQLVAAMAALHRFAPESAHGALAPERIILSDDGRVVVAEYVLGSALEQLHFSRDHYWKALRVAVPSAASPPRLDARTDVNQLGTVALALIVGRPLRDDEYPARVADLVDTVRAIAPTGPEPLPPAVHDWLRRALQLHPRSFGSAVDAQEAFEDGWRADDSTEALLAFLAQCREASAGGPEEEPGTGATAAAIDGVAHADVRGDLPPSWPLAQAAGERLAPERPDTQAARRVGDDRFAASAPPIEPARTLMSDGPDEISEQPALQSRARRLLTRGRLAAAAAILVALSSAGMVAARRFLWAEPMGRLTVASKPAGAIVVIDGREHGSTPVAVELPAGSHSIQIVADGQVRTIPVTIAAGAHVAQFVELSVADPVPVTGQLEIRTEPRGARVSVDGEPRGLSPVTIDGLTPGVHTVTLENELGTVTQQVTIDAGATALLVVPMDAPRGAPVSGWITVAAPVEVQIYEDQRLLGTSRSERLMLPAGRHELEIVNETLGFRVSRVVQVAPGRVTPVRFEWPRGILALNALPWAEVWLDGERLGETPIGNIPVPIGPHQVLFRHPELGERAYTVTVTLTGPTRVSADFGK